MTSVMLVEDDDDIREGLEDVLTGKGYAVTQVSNAQRALDLLRGGARPAVIILDLMMPVMDGVQFLQHRAIDPSLGSSPVIILTAQTAVAAELVESVAAVLPKPVPLARLLAVLAGVIEGTIAEGSGTRRLVESESGRGPDRRAMPRGRERRRLQFPIRLMRSTGPSGTGT